MKNTWMFTFLLAFAISLTSPLVSLSPVDAKPNPPNPNAQQTCPEGNGWIKVDSYDWSTYPVAGATQYCFKAGSDNSQGCEGGLFQTWPQEGACGLSHWSYKIGGSPQPTPSPRPTPTPSPRPTPTPCPTPLQTQRIGLNTGVQPSPSPCIEPTPSPTPNPSPTPEISPTPSPSPSPTPTPTPSPEVEPSPSPSPTPTPNPSPSPTPSSNDDPDDSNDSSDDSAVGGIQVPETQGQVLGATTYAETGIVTDVLMSALGVSGAGLTAAGYVLHAKKA